MNKIQIFPQEIEDGISDAVQTQACVAYCSEVSYKPDNGIIDNTVVRKIIAENKNQLDLYYLESVLVSVGWNKNDDVFLNDETHAARHTPEDKQFNYMHDENDIIGHITGSYVVDKEGNVIANEVETPDNFDIVTQAVIYNSWMNEDNRERMAQIIAEIEEGDKWFVSMECLFAGFDYAVIDETGKSVILERNEASAFLTKHLRCYGGEGKYEGLQVGRALRNISFSGKGLVSKPANPDSVILSPKTETKAFFANATEKTINSTLGDPEMAEDTKQVIADLKEQLKDAAKAIKDQKDDIDAVQAQKLADAESALVTSTELVDTHVKTIEEAVTQAEESAATIADLEAQLLVAKEDAKKAEKFKKDKEKEDKDAKRTASLIEAGLDAEKAAVTCASLDALEDEAFESVVIVIAEKSAAAASSDSDESTSAEDSELNLSDLDGVETTEATLVDGSDATDASEKVRADVADWFSKNVSQTAK